MTSSINQNMDSPSHAGTEMQSSCTLSMPMFGIYRTIHPSDHYKSNKNIYEQE